MYIVLTSSSGKEYAIKVDRLEESFKADPEDGVSLEREDGGVFVTVNPDSLDSIAFYEDHKYNKVGYLWNILTTEEFEEVIKSLA